jgi:hypothetical protein
MDMVARVLPYISVRMGVCGWVSECVFVCVCVKPWCFCKQGNFAQSEKEPVTTYSERFVFSFRSDNCEIRNHSDIV